MKSASNGIAVTNGVAENGVEPSKVKDIEDIIPNISKDEPLDKKK